MVHKEINHASKSSFTMSRAKSRSMLEDEGHSAADLHVHQAVDDDHQQMLPVGNFKSIFQRDEHGNLRSSNDKSAFGGDKSNRGTLHSQSAMSSAIS